MISRRRRIFLIIGSVTVGSILAAMLIIARFGKLKPENTGNMIVNFAFSLAIVFGISLFLSRNNKKTKEKD